MPKVRWLGPALSDLAEIKAFYEEKEAGLGQRLIEEILGIECQLTDFPLTGRVSKNLRPEHRELIRAPHLVVYRVEFEVVKIVAVIDCRRDFSAAWLSKKR